MSAPSNLSDRVVELIRAQIVAIARQPANNPVVLDFARYTLPLIAHDYPAMTAVMWNAAYQTLGLDVGNCMLVADPRASRRILEAFRGEPRYLGGGVGVGFKEEVIPHLDELDAVATIVGSVNLIVKTPAGKLRGCNTDGLGYILSLEEFLHARGEKLAGKRIVLIGAAGTAGAMAFALAERGAGLVIVNRTRPRADALVRKINEHLRVNAAIAADETELPAYLRRSDVVVNASAKGAVGELQDYSALAPAVLPATPKHIRFNLAEAERAFALLSPQTLISDVVLAPGGTPLLRMARGKGVATLDGIGMVVAQGIEAFWIIHGDELTSRGVAREKVAEIMRRAASDCGPV